LPPKREVATALLGKGSLFVHLDPRAVGVEVPDWLKQQPQLVLQVGLQMLIPIPDLRVDADGVFGTLSFSRHPFACYVPWDAVFALVGDDGRGMVWPESMPAEIAAEVDREAVRAKRSQEERAENPGEPRTPRLTGSRSQLTASASSNATDGAPRLASLVGTKEPYGQLRLTAARAPMRSASGSEPTSRSASGSKPKSTPRLVPKRRELPPYLRVVK
jgi:stringent starvation protein B